MASSMFVQETLRAAFFTVLLLASQGSFAFRPYLADFGSKYPNSTTEDTAQCMTCHGGDATGNEDTGTFNRFGDALSRLSGTIAQRLAAIELQDADGEGTSNLDEIGAGAQPGWCEAAAANCNNNGFTPPESFRPFDPPAGNQLPTANPGGPYNATVGVPVTLDGTGSSDDDGTVVSFSWQFGDGTSGSGAIPSTTYRSAGSFTVTLVVTDDAGGASAAAMTTVTVNVGQQPPTADAGGPYDGSVGVPIAFDGGKSSDPDGTVVSYDWDFGDGNTGTGPTPIHAFAAGGTYAISLTVTDNDGLTNTDQTTALVNDGTGMQAPVAEPGGPYMATTGEAIAFDGSGSWDPDGTVVSFDWDFGDGNTGSGAMPTHAYTVAGVYTVALTVVDDTGRTDTTMTSADVIDPVNELPVAAPGGPYRALPGATVSFDGSASFDPDGNVMSYAWEFGDGATGSGANPTHAYALAGEYQVILRVTDDSGAEGDPVATSAIIGEAADGAATYAANCADCHGDPWAGAAIDNSLPGSRRVAGASVCTIEGAIFGTSVFPGGVKDMVAYGNQRLSTDEIASIAGYLNSRDGSGEQLYVAACAGCHGNEGNGGRVDARVRGEDAGDIGEAIREESTMTFLACLTATDIEVIATYLGDGDDADCETDEDCSERKQEQEKRRKCKRDDDCDADGRRDEEDDDDDNDGMPDVYEESKRFNPFDPDDARQDPDRDGKSNLAEYRAGTDPLDASSTPAGPAGGAGGMDPYSLGALGFMLLIGLRRRSFSRDLIPARE